MYAQIHCVRRVRLLIPARDTTTSARACLRLSTIGARVRRTDVRRRKKLLTATELASNCFRALHVRQREDNSPHRQFSPKQ